MAKTIKLRKGFDIRLAGKANEKLGEFTAPKTFAVKPTDFRGIMRPKLLVSEGDTVQAGTPVLYCKMLEQVKYSAPVSGEVVEIRRGEKRKLLEIVILADKEIEYEKYPSFAPSDLQNITREEALEPMLKSGVWPNIVQRPYGVVANPEDKPKSIFISAFDSHPLAASYEFIFRDQENAFQAGIEVLKRFTDGRIHLGLNGNAEVSKVFSHIKDVDLHRFSGPHPAGNVGTHVHMIDPVGKGDIVWTVDPYGVIQIGKLFLEGKFDASKIIALTGSEVKDPQYYKTHAGANVETLLENKLTAEKVRVVSGNVLTGEKIAPNGYLGHYDHQITVIPEGNHHEMFGWLLPTFNKLSFHRAFGLLSFLTPHKDHVIDTNTKGEKRAFVQSGIFERVTPIDILPTYLLKAIMAEDYDDMEALGIFEVIEEDLALCEFVDVSKHDVQTILREGLNLMKNS